MNVHHLNCGTMHMPGAPLVCHVLLVETNNGLVLVDTGYGLQDIANPARRLGPYRHITRPILDPDETAVRQLARLGFDTNDVRHIVVTHLDEDHIGGLADFPDARVHITCAEASGALRSPTWRERLRYRRAQWEHGPTIVEHDPDGETWRGFAAARELDEIAPGIVFVSLPGHTRGHAAVAIDAGSRWLLHAGDSFYHHGQLDGRSTVPGVLRAQETLLAFRPAQVRENHARLAELHRRAEPDLFIICAHDPTLYAECAPRLNTAADKSGPQPTLPPGPT